MARMRWDLFCRVVDNFGDVGVCWRLAADLGGRGETVRLWIDDASALAWLAPQGADGVTVHPWSDAEGEAGSEPVAVVIEAFGCDPPPRFVRHMAERSVAGSPRPPLWINLEYLSAEDYVERSHGLPSPQQSGPGRGLIKWFFFPGFSAGSGGLLREPGLQAAQAGFDARGWLADQGLSGRPGPSAAPRLPTLAALAVRPELPELPELTSRSGSFSPSIPPGALQAAARPLASVFCYDAAGLAPPPGMRLLLAPGAAQRQFGDRPDSLCLPWLAQPDYDRLLWSCELNIVRGEDSFVRAQWAGAPFIWHIYPQHDGAHRAKLDAFLDRFLAGAEPSFAADLRRLWRAWNGLSPSSADPAADPANAAAAAGRGVPGGSALTWPDASPWRAACAAWRQGLLGQSDLVTRLLALVAARS